MPRPVFDRPIAHRGLHDRSRGIIENSRSAFEAAIAHGYAIECDVQLSKDGEPYIFHDDDLERLTGVTGPSGGLPIAEARSRLRRSSGSSNERHTAARSARCSSRWPEEPCSRSNSRSSPTAQRAAPTRLRGGRCASSPYSRGHLHASNLRPSARPSICDGAGVTGADGHRHATTTTATRSDRHRFVVPRFVLRHLLHWPWTRFDFISLPQPEPLSSGGALSAGARHARDGVDHQHPSRPRAPRCSAPIRSCSKGSCRKLAETLHSRDRRRRRPKIDAAQWNALAAASDAHANPFLDHAFFLALEESGCATRRTGWSPRHILLQAGQRDRRPHAAVREDAFAGRIRLRPWLGQCLRTGRRKLLSQAAMRRCRSPPSPRPSSWCARVTMRRNRPPRRRRAACGTARRFSSVHATFVPEAEAQLAADAQWLTRTDTQYHWHNAGFGSVRRLPRDDVLAAPQDHPAANAAMRSTASPCAG